MTDTATSPTIARLRAKREAIAETKTIDLPIPGYNGELVARYRPLEWTELRTLLRRQEASRSDDPELEGGADLLIRACEEFLIRDEEGELRPMAEILGDNEPVRYDDQLAAAFEIEFEGGGRGSAREVVYGVFSNDVALMDHQNRLFNAMRETNGDIDADF